MNKFVCASHWTINTKKKRGKKRIIVNQVDRFILVKKRKIYEKLAKRNSFFYLKSKTKRWQVLLFFFFLFQLIDWIDLLNISKTANYRTSHGEILFLMNVRFVIERNIEGWKEKNRTTKENITRTFNRKVIFKQGNISLTRTNLISEPTVVRELFESFSLSFHIFFLCVCLKSFEWSRSRNNFRFVFREPNPSYSLQN